MIRRLADLGRRAVAWARAHKLAKRAAALGAVLALACHFMPKDAKAICEAIASICTGG